MNTSAQIALQVCSSHVNVDIKLRLLIPTLIRFSPVFEEGALYLREKIVHDKKASPGKPEVSSRQLS